MSKKVLSLEKDLCRCCHSEGSFRSLYTPYFLLEVEQVYGNMLRECLDIELVNVSERLACAICDACIQRLQDAAQFKHQVQQCEIQFKNLYTNVSVTRRFKHKSKIMLSKEKRNVGRPRKHTVFLKNNEIEIGYSNKSMTEGSYSNNMNEIVYGNRSMEEISYSNKDMIGIVSSNVKIKEICDSNKDIRELSSSNKNIDENGYSNQNIKEIGDRNRYMRKLCSSNKSLQENEYSNENIKKIGDRNKNMRELDSSNRSLQENEYSNEMSIDNNFEYDSDTPISRLSKEFADKEKIVKNEKPGLVGLKESVKVIRKEAQYRLHCDTKPVSERKRIRVTCETVLRDTTACPFRHHRSWFRCFYCIEEFMDIDELRQHTLQNHNAEDIANIKIYPRSLQIDKSDFRCKICCEHLTDVKNMVEHLLKVHGKVVYKECIADYKVNTSPYTCHLCRKQYHVFRTLTTHLNEHYANYICDVCGKPYLNTKRLKVHKRTHESGNFPCTECGKILKTKTSKANHMESHSKRILKCHLCSKPMKHYNDRIKHMSEEHNITHNFKCVICGREYHIKHYLATHMRQTHGHKNKKCMECGMAFITNHGLKKHMLKHSGDKGFPCSICNKAYARSYTLKEHMRGHESEKADQ